MSPQPTLRGVVGHRCGPAVSEIVVVGGQLLRCCRRGLRDLSTGEVAAFDRGQPHFLRPDDRAEQRADAGLGAVPVPNHLSGRDLLCPLVFGQLRGLVDQIGGIGDVVGHHQLGNVGLVAVAVAVQPQRLRRVEMQAVRRGQPELDVRGARRWHAVRATEGAREHLRRRPALGGGHRGHRLAAVQAPGRALQRDAATQRCRGLAGQPAHFPGEVEFRRVAAARHVADGGVVGVDNRVE